MTETTLLLKQKGDVTCYNAIHGIGDTSSEISEGNEILVNEAETKIPLAEIVIALYSAWRRNGANEDLTPQDIMAMQKEYKRVTHKRQVPYTLHAIWNELTDIMFFYLRHTRFYNSDFSAMERRLKILRNLQENWPSIASLDESFSDSLSVHSSPTGRKRIQNAWTNLYTNLQTLVSDVSFQLLLSVILLSWPLSVMVMGAKFMSQCPMSNFLPDSMIAAGVLGIAALLLRLVFASIEKWCWFPMRTVIPNLWTTLKFVELFFLIALAIQLWFFFKESPSFESQDPKFCDETFYTFTFWMTHVSSAFAGIWLIAYFVKAVYWITRIRYHYMPPFYNNSEMNSFSSTECAH